MQWSMLTKNDFIMVQRCHLPPKYHLAQLCPLHTLLSRLNIIEHKF